MKTFAAARQSIFMRYFLMFMLFTPLWIQAKGQSFTLKEYKLSTYFVNDYKVSPNGQYMVFNTIAFKDGQLESSFYLKDLKRGAKKSLGQKDAFIHGWIDDKHVVFGDGSDEYTVQNIHTLQTSKIPTSFSMYNELLFISPEQTITCDIEMDKTTYYFYKNNKLKKELTNNRFLDLNFFDVASQSILELTPQKKHDFSKLDIYQFSFESNTRNKIATIPSSKNSVIQEVSLRGDMIYYLEQVQTYSRLEEHLWQKVKVKLCSYDMKSKSHKVIHTFNQGTECLNLEIIGNDQFLVLLKDHKNDNNEVLDEPVNDNGMNVGFDFGPKLMLLEKTVPQEK